MDETSENTIDVKITTSPEIALVLSLVTDEINSLREQNQMLLSALKMAIIPLEVLHLDNNAGARWMSASVKKLLGEAVIAIRQAVSVVSENKGG